MKTLIVTVIFLLADGTPAKHAWVYCTGIVIGLIGSDTGETIEDAALALDSRGAMIVVDVPKTIQCSASQQGQSWRGPIALTKAHQVIRIRLTGDAHGGPE